MAPRKKSRKSSEEFEPEQEQEQYEPSIISVVSSDDEGYASAASSSSSARPVKKKPKTIRRVKSNGQLTIPIPKNKAGRSPPATGKGKAKAEPLDIEDAAGHVTRPHTRAYHSVQDVAALSTDLLEWFEGVREKRGMPWRRPYDPSLSDEEKGQRAYEIWVSEVMLQQTQVSTVIAYWQKWIEKWPSIADLAKADIEEVNAAWRGLGYYRRARSLLKGAQTVMASSKYKGRLPSSPEVLEKEIDGVGRYTAGAICSMAYGARTPIVDGNIHRLFTRLLAVHAPQTAPWTIKFLWAAATELVGSLPTGDERAGVAGDWNQALMELGSQICKPVSPDCPRCPLRSSCKAYAELSTSPPSVGTGCDLCAPIPLDRAHKGGGIPSVTIFPMRKEKKKSREEEEVVCVVEWAGPERKWLFTKRPEQGLLAGLFQPPTTPIPAESSPDSRKEATNATLETLLTSGYEIVSHTESGSIPHIFSHINMTYHIQRLVLRSPDCPLVIDGSAVWLSADEVEAANVGTGVKKVWKEVYGDWGKFDASPEASQTRAAPKGKKANANKNASAIFTDGADGRTKVTKKVMMPMMPGPASTLGK